MSHDVEIILKYCLMMGQNRQAEAALIDFPKKSHFVGNE